MDCAFRLHGLFIFGNDWVGVMGLRDDLAIEEAKVTLSAAQDRLNYLQGKGRYAHENWPRMSMPGLLPFMRGPKIPPPPPPPVPGGLIEAAEKLLKKAHVHG